ncbi:HK97 family phage prohead protease [Candidatus Dependentiae bacterium]|nr:MAG: HK97 family phage prohead protease [Candidatus Dependentiae bacterium]
MSNERKREQRSISKIEFRAEDGEQKVVRGYAALFNSETQLAPNVVEKIAPGAFASSIGGDVRALWNHNMDLILGRTTNGSLILREDGTGLAFELRMPDTTFGMDKYKEIASGLVTGVSFGFFVNKESWVRGSDTTPHMRILEDVELLEISPTPFPAYEGTSVSARSLEQVIKEKLAEWGGEAAAQRSFDAERKQRHLELVLKTEAAIR